VPASTDDHVFYAGNGANASNELFRIKGNGSIGVSGNTGVQGDVLVSGGAGAAAWQSISSALPYIRRQNNVIPSNTEEGLNDLTINFVTSRNTRVLVWIDIALINFGACIVGPCPVSGKLVTRMNGGSTESASYISAFYPGAESLDTRSFRVLEYNVGPGNHQFTIAGSKTSGGSYRIFVDAKMLQFAN
jgi:hypothetical protein